MFLRLRMTHLIAAAVVAIAWTSDFNTKTAQAQVVPRATAPIFQNYYTSPMTPGVPAQMYLSPRPTPMLVGHTWVTYQPFMPHEFLYKHHATYCRKQPGRVLPLNVTHVSWW
jgi:hypothetical protein